MKFWRSVLFCTLVAAFVQAADPKLAQKSFQEGLRFEEGSQWKKAETAFTSAIQADPGQLTYFLHRAHARIQLADYAHALEDAGAAMRLNPGSAEAFQLRGDIYAKQDEP